MATGSGASSLKTAFANFADKADGKEMSNKAATRWFTDAKILTKKTCTSQNLDIAFSAAKPKGKPNITFAELDDLINRVAEAYGRDSGCSKDEAVGRIKDILGGASKEGHGTTGVSKTGGVDRMTDVGGYTGSHKERFDAETGKGKGKDGRENMVENSGYVGNYKDAGTYDKKH